MSRSVSLFARSRHLDATFDFNGILSGSNGQPPASALAALNGNGLLQETVLDHATTRMRDWDNDVGVKWDYSGGAIDNSLTVGAMYGGHTRTRVNQHNVAGTVGVNDTLDLHLALDARYAKGFQTYGGNSGGAASVPSDLTPYEGGVRFQFSGLVGSVVGFRTEFRDQCYTFTNPDKPAIRNNAQADDNVNGVQVDAGFRPVRFFSLSESGVHQDPKLTNLRFNGVVQGVYDSNIPERTPKKLLTVTSSFVLPGHRGEIYGR